MNGPASPTWEEIPAPTCIALVMLGLVELLAGLLALLGAVLLWLETAPGMNALAFGVLSPLTILVPGGVGIFVRRKWSYLLHCLVIPVALVGAALFLGFFAGMARGLPAILVTLFASAVMELFFLSPGMCATGSDSRPEPGLSRTSILRFTFG